MFTRITETLRKLDSTGELYVRYHFLLCNGNPMPTRTNPDPGPLDICIMVRECGLHEGEAKHEEAKRLLTRDACDSLAALILTHRVTSEHFTLTRREYVRPQPPPESGRPLNCECDNTHENNRSCCRPCWAAGFRAVPNPKPATTYAFAEGAFVRLHHGRPETEIFTVEYEAKMLLDSLTPEERAYITDPARPDRGFAALHDLCDANMRLPGADDASGIPACDQSYVAFCNAVMSRFNEILITPKP